ncbi:hypothetical protein HN51_062156 [Arachis hypogaea]
MHRQCHTLRPQCIVLFYHFLRSVYQHHPYSQELRGYELQSRWKNTFNQFLPLHSIREPHSQPLLVTTATSVAHFLDSQLSSSSFARLPHLPPASFFLFHLDFCFTVIELPAVVSSRHHRFIQPPPCCQIIAILPTVSLSMHLLTSQLTSSSYRQRYKYAYCHLLMIVFHLIPQMMLFNA